MKQFFLTILFLFISAIVAFAQSAIELEEYNVDRGLSQSLVTFIEQDSRGFLWVGTGEGLNRFNGFEFKQYFKEVDNAKSINNNTIRGLAADKKGGIWVGTDIGLNYYDPNTNTFERHSLSKRLNLLIYSPAIVSDSFVYGSCSAGYVFKFNLFDNSISLINIPIKAKNYRPHGDKNGNIWFEIDKQTLLRYDTKKAKYTVHTFSNPIESFNLNKDKKPVVFFSNNAFIIQINNDALSMLEIATQKNNPGAIKMATSDSNCIWSIDKKNQLNCLLNKSNTLLSNTKIGNALSIVQTMYIDQSGTLWIATDGNGLIMAKVQKQRFNSFNTSAKNTINKHFIKCMAESADGSIYVGTLDQEIIKYTPDLASFETIKVFNNEPVVPINGMLFDKDENLWILTDKYIKIKHKNGQFTTVNEPFCKGIMMWNNQIVISAYNKLYFFNSNDPTIKKISTIEQSIRYFFPLNKEELFISFQITGAAIYNIRTSKFTKIISALADVKAIMLHKESNNSYYLASDDGIIQLDKDFNIVATINRKDGLCDHFVYALLKDKNGLLWGSTNQGIFSFNPMNKNIQSFGLSDGLNSLEFNSNAHLIDSKGRFFFGGIKGFSTISPNNLKTNQNTIPVYLNLIKTDNKLLIPSKKNINLNSNDNDIYVEFDLPDLLTPKRNRLSIFLKGFHTDWQPLFFKRTAKFESLPPGKYTLLAKTINSDGVESETYVLSQFKIAYPIWKNPYYIAIVSILIIVFFSFITLLVVRSRHKAKIASLQRKNEIEGIRKNIYRDLHDEIGAGLSRIKILSDIALLEKENNEQSLELVKESATEITEKLREIVWSMNQENENLNKLSQKLQTTAEVLFSNLEIQLLLTLEDGIPKIELPPIKIRNILMVYREIINNIIKHSHATQVEINIEWVDNIYTILIKDNGKGFNTESDFKDSNGLKIIKDRMDELHATLTIKSEIGNGTAIEFKVPIHMY